MINARATTKEIVEKLLKELKSYNGEYLLHAVKKEQKAKRKIGDTQKTKTKVADINHIKC